MTELMGGFAIPRFLKVQRRGKRYLLLGLRLNRDTERIVLYRPSRHERARTTMRSAPALEIFVSRFVLTE